jgi:single-stranded-DNA-specific exonuclease
MDGEVLPKPLFSRLSSAAEAFSQHPEVRVVTHYDADGISSAGILTSVLMRKGKRFQLSMVKSLDENIIREASAGAKCLILADMGSSYISLLETLDSQVIVLDHHSLQGDSQKVVHVNPHLFGIDGMTSGCAGAMCMMFALAVDEANLDLLPIAFAGIVGDRQHIRGLSGVNKYLLERGMARKVVEVRLGSLLPEGRLADELADCADPYIIGVSGDKQGAMDLIREAGLPQDSTLAQLSENERRKLSSLVALRLLAQGCTISAMEELITDRFYFPKWGVFADDLAQLLNACGRTDQEGVGVALALRDMSALQVAEKLRREYKDALLAGMAAIMKEGVSKRQHIQFFHSSNPSLSGALCGLTMQFVADSEKPTIALSIHPDKTRVSSRASFRILEKGVDLAVALREAAGAVGGVGCGHAVASGATIPKGKEEEFIDRLDDIVGAQKLKKAQPSP